MKPLTSKADVIRYMSNNPGIKFDADSIAKHFLCGINNIRSLLKALTAEGRINSNRTNNMKQAAKYWYPEITINVSDVAAKPIKPLQMTLAKRIALERCAELYPADRHHFECVSKIPGNPSLKGDE